MNVFVFLWYHWWRGLPVDADLNVGLWHWIFLRVLISSGGVRTVLKQKDTSLPWIYQAFNNVVGHTESINCQSTQNRVWTSKHAGLARAVASVNFGPIFLKHHRASHRIFLQTQRLDEAVRHFTRCSWFDGCFGNHHLAWEAHASLTRYLACNFHDCSYWKWPIIGPWLASCIAWWNQRTLDHINSLIDCIYREVTDDSIFGRLKAQNYSPRFVRESMFLAFLVSDFLEETCIQKVWQSYQSEKVETQTVAKAFFYPWRLRRTGCFQWTALNLVRSGHFFSAGPRSCVGPVIAGKFFQGAVDLFQNYLSSLECHPPQRHPGDRPLLKSPLKVTHYTPKLAVPFRSSPDQKGLRLYHLNALSWQPVSRLYIQHFFRQQIDQHWYRGTLVIVSPEARGWVWSAPLADYYGCPLVLARKRGKEKGCEVHKTKEYKTPYSTDQLEVPVNSPLNENSFAVVLDDGVATGGSLNAMICMLQTRFHVSNFLILSVVRHVYDGTDLKANPFAPHPYEYFSELKQPV